MSAVLHTILVFVALLALNNLCRRSKWIALAFFLVLPLVLTGTVWTDNGTAAGSSVNSWFHWAKVYSVLFGCLWITALNYTKLGEHNWAKFIVAAIVAVNILEGVVRDMQLFFVGDQIAIFGAGQAAIGRYGVYHLMNAAAGALAIATLSGWNGIRSEGGRSRDLIWPDMQLLWIVAYSLWNFAYIYNCVPIHAAFGIAVLLIPSLFIKKGIWLQARGYTLAGWMMYVMAVTPFIDKPGNHIALPYTAVPLIAVSGISLALNLWFAAVHFGKRRRVPASGFGQEVYSSSGLPAAVLAAGK
ncbi:MAG: DUF5692 family protein [Acidobacteriaceae bacterium]